jgi:hypothetical protein
MVTGRLPPKRKYVEVARSNTLESNRTVTFQRQVLVPHPKNKFENQRFGIELSDPRSPQETYAEVYDRLREVALNILANDIHDYVNGANNMFHEHALNEVRRKYNLF